MKRAVIAPLPEAGQGVDALWPQCLAVVARRRQAPPQAALPPGLVWRAAGGWELGPQPWDAAARDLFALFKPLLDRPAGGQPWVVGQLGQSLDGCIATRTGDSVPLNGPEALTHLHRLRAVCDAVIVGAATAALDNPQLTTRRVAGDHPVRVLLDPRAGLGADLRMFRDDAAPTWLACDAGYAGAAAQRLGAARVLAVPGLLDDAGALQLAPFVRALGARGLSVLFVEGGGITVSRFIAQGLLDRLHLSIAPVLVGAGRPGLQLPLQGALLRDCPRPPARLHALGQDMLWDLDLRAAPAPVAA